MRAIKTKKINLRNDFLRCFDENWEMAKRYLKSTLSSNSFDGSLKEPVKKILYDYATKTGCYPSHDNIREVYLWCLNNKEVENIEYFIRSKAKREQAEQKRRRKKAERKARRKRGEYRGFTK